jgi:cohesin domain-containing protein/PEP-CTERM motif-containing protein
MVRYPYWAIVVLFLALSLAPGTSHADPCTGCIITAGSDTVTVGETFTIPISITNALGVDLTSFQFDLAFDPVILQANEAGATAGSLLPGDWFFTSPGAVDNTGGDILGVSAFGSAVSGSGVLANIEFQALAVGESLLTLSNVFLNFEDSGFLTVNGLVTVIPAGAPIPEPGTVTLLSLGLGVLAWHRRRGSGTASGGGPPGP